MPGAGNVRFGLGWMQKLIEHRIADRRMVRLLMKWPYAGVMKNEELREVTEAAPQGGGISPLLSNVFLHMRLTCGCNSGESGRGTAKPLRKRASSRCLRTIEPWLRFIQLCNSAGTKSFNGGTSAHVGR
jgi:hypothetical protein